MANLLETSGAQPQKQAKYVPIFIDKAFTGIYTQRSVLHDPSDFATARFYGGRPDALWQGSNIELTNRLTLQRRPGLVPFSTATYPTLPNRAFSFELTNGTIQVIIDTGSTGDLAISSVADSSGGSAVYTGVFPNADSNAYAGLAFQISGFTNTVNNGTYICTASSTTTLTLSNATAISETIAANAVSFGAVYYDQQNGSKTLLFAKSPGAGQTYFVAVGGILYMGDGVDTNQYTPMNTNGTIWDWGIAAPTAQPSVVITASGAASVQWQANTVWSTMGLIYDATTNTTQQLLSVNESGTNTTRFGTTGDGEPNWDQTPGGITMDNTINWKNNGPIVLWTANTLYNSAVTGGNASAPCIIYDPVTKACYFNANIGNTPGTSGSGYPIFHPGANQFTQDGSVRWLALPGIPGTWQANTFYSTAASQGTVTEPVSLINGLPSNVTVYWQFSSGGTSGAGGTAPPWSTLEGQQTTDGDLIWLCLGSDQWSATSNVSAWTANGTVFTAIKDTNGNFQVCTMTGTTGTVEPGTSFVLSAASNAVSGQTTYTGTFSPTIPVGAGNLSIKISGFTTGANNGTFTIVSCSATQLVVANAAGVAETHSGTAIYNAWGAGYGSTTPDGTAVWTCVGTSMAWADSTIWYLPVVGFSPPSSSSPYGGASVIDSNDNVEFIVDSGLGGGSTPSWQSIGGYTPDGGSPLTLTSVAVSGGLATYNGTITGGGANAFAGKTFIIAGFSDAGNNVLISVLSSSAATLVCTATTQINETHAGTATTGAIWFDLEAFNANSLAWTKGYVYAYSFKARALDDFYSIPINGALPIPPGLTNALPTPTGSETNDISTASPVFTIIGPNSGAVNTISGFGSTNPAVDTIVIWRSADGGGSSNMFELTEIPAPPPIGGIAQPWSFNDYLPDTPTALYPGLDNLIPAPIENSNNPPSPAFLPMAYNFQRIWGAVGSTVFFSGGPDILTGNPDAAFDPADDFPFLANVTRLVKTSQGLVTFLTNSIEVIAGGPLTSSFYQVSLATGLGLLNYNGLDAYAGEIFFFSSDSQFMMLSPSLNLSTAGFPLGDQFAQWNAANAQVAVQQAGVDNCIMVADGSTGWYRVNPRQIPGGANGPEPVWSPFANITNGCMMVQSVEISPGIKKLLVGATTPNQSILQRSLSIFSDNGSAYDAYFVMGSITLAHPGQLAVLKFIEADFSGVEYQPTISYLLNEISGSFTPFTAAPQFDPPSLYGTTIAPTSYSPQRYYFAGNAAVARCRHMQIRVDLGTNTVGSELYNLTIFGRLMIEL